MAYPISRVTTWIDGNILTASALNAEFNNIINNMTLSNIDDASSNVSAMQANTDPGGLGTESRPSDLLGEIQRLRFAVKRLFSGAQWYSTPDRTFDALLNAQTSDFVDASVTQVKMGPSNYVISDLCDGFPVVSSTLADVDNLTVNITTIGRPVLLMLINDSSFFKGYINLLNPPVNLEMQLSFVRDTTQLTLFELMIDQHSYGGFRPLLGKSFPLSGHKFIDHPAAGTYTYKVQAANPAVTGSDANFYGTKLIAIEL